jgi:hypothetical protein
MMEAFDLFMREHAFDVVLLAIAALATVPVYFKLRYGKPECDCQCKCPCKCHGQHDLM